MRFAVAKLQSSLVAGAFLSILCATTALAVLGDIPFERKGQSAEDAVEIPPAVFPHWFHRIRFRCYVCHPDVFVMKRGANSITMDDIRAGKFCGQCHNGGVAWGLSFEVCALCHRTP